jgi:hypothetical protein
MYKKKLKIKTLKKKNTKQNFTRNKNSKNNKLIGGSNNIPEDIKKITINDTKTQYKTSILIPNKKNTSSSLVWFNLVKLTNNNIWYWTLYAKYQLLQERNCEGIGAGASALLESLRLFHHSDRNNFDVWIAYAYYSTSLELQLQLQSIPEITKAENETFYSMIEQKDIKIQNGFNNIYMVLSLFINKESPITSHMGIFKSCKYYFDKSLYNLSVYLHSFTAKVSQLIYPNKIYMVTRPTRLMRSILLKSLFVFYPKINPFTFLIVCSGDEEDRLKYIEEAKNIETFNIINPDGIDNIEKSFVYLYPKDNIMDTTLLNGKERIKWTIIYDKDDCEQEFDIPYWFKHHQYLNSDSYHLSTIIIDINHLGNLYFIDYNL